MARNSRAVGCLTVFFGLAIVGGCMRLFGYESESEKAAAAAETVRIAGLPDLIGKTLVEAENSAKTMDVRLSDGGIGPTSSCDDKTDCIVFRMSPKAGTVVKKYGEFAVTWTTGDERAWYGKWTKMPKVIGWSETKAERFFKPVEAAVEQETAESKKVPVGKDLVIAQSPKPGAPVKLGQKIRIVIGYNYGTSTSTGDTDLDGKVDVDADHNNGESRYCSRKWWC